MRSVAYARPKLNHAAHVKGKFCLRTYINLLQDNPNFTRLWIAQIVSLLGDWFSTIVLAAMIADFTAGSRFEGLAVSALFLSQFLPPLLASPVAGALVDRFDRKMLLVWSNLLRAVVVLGLLFVRDASTLWLLYLLRVVQFTLSAVFEPGQSALVPSLVPREDLTKANTLLSTTWSVMLAVGAVIGGIVGALLGTQAAILIDAVTFVLAGYLIYTLRVEAKPASAAPAQTTGTTQDGSFGEALQYLRRHPNKIPDLTIKFGGSIGNIDTILTFYATNLFILGERGELSIGILYASFGVGALVGPFLLNPFHRDRLNGLRRMVLIGFFAVSLGWLGLGAAPTLAIATAAIAFRAMGNSVNWVYSTTLIQKTVPDEYLGRVFAIDIGGFYLASVISLFVHGLLIDVFGSEHIRVIVYGTGAVSLLPLLWWCWVVYRQERTAAVSVAANSGD